MLRGINVSGQKKVNMQELKTIYQELNLQNVRTYIQSGNVIFESPESEPAYLSSQISDKLFQKYAFEIPVLVTKAAELETIVAGNLFLQKEGTVTEKLHVTFLWHTPESQNLEKLKAVNFEPDKFIVCNKVIYVYCADGYGRTKLTNTFFENKLKTTATTRNWRTVNELLKIAALI